jgi:2-keto-4-pentenoate hydratase/2-oxohepta-3-ene-1,7-dioic acid hydratase in catechol pathway
VKLLRVGAAGAERPALLAADGTLRDLSGLTGDIDGAFLAGLAGGGLDRLNSAAAELPPLESPERVGPPVARPGKVVCLGLNYRDHAAETGAAAPAEPILFMKAPYTVVGPDDDVIIPRGSVKTDYEVELAVVIGGTARYLDGPEQARAVIAGYAVSNDVSEREFQLERGGTWDKGKSCETFNPLGPYLVTADEVPDPQALGMKLWVNGESRQDGNTKDMIFGVYETVAYLSRFMVLEPGDVINTGTPAGVAMGRSDKAFLRAGDLVELTIDGLGRQRQRLADA